MSQTDLFSFYPAAYRGRQFKPTVILLTSLLMSVVWWHFGRFPFYDEHFASRFALWGDPEATRAVYTYVNCFLLLGVIPALIVKLVFREKLSDYGVQLGDWRRGLRALLMLAPLFVLAAYVGSGKSPVSEYLGWRPPVADFYPINKSAGNSAGMFGFHACTYMLLYLGFEFHYRGFVQFGLRDSVGEINALLVQVTASVFINLGKTPNETFGAILCGFLWGILAFRTRSILSGMLQHALLGLSLDFFICFG